MQPDEATPAGSRIPSERQRGFLNALLENIDDGIVACDADGVLTVFNHAARALHGLPEEPTPAELWAERYDLYMPDGLTRMSKEDVPLYRALQGEHVRDVEMVVAPKGGARRTLLASGGLVYGERGEKLGAVVVMRDFTERKAVQESLVRESSLLRALLENVPDAIYFKDTEGRFTRVNRHAPYRGDHPPEEVIGKTDFDFFVEEHARAAREDELRVIRSGRPIVDKEEKETYPDGSITWLSTTKAPIFDGSGRVTGLVGISRDITERKQAEEARVELAREQAARVEAERLNRLKDEFLATLSHELRTPLTAILGWAKMLTGGHVEEARRAEALEVIVRNATAQAQLIDDLLDVSRIITGKLRLAVQPLELAPLIEGAVESFRPAAEARGVGLRASLDPRGCVVSGDAHRLRQVVWNLLSNAVKFTPGGGEVFIRLSRGGSNAEVSVSDTGQGIEPEFLPHAFERFRQADSSTTRRHGGLGLGLAVVRHLVEMHGGTVSARSEGEGRGAEFILTLPLAPTQDNTPDAGPKHAGDLLRGRAALLEGLTILAVDDEPDTLDLIKLVLERCGARVITAARASEALRLLTARRPDVLVSDIGMSDMDGYDLIREVRRLPADAGGGTPALALTAYAGEDSRARALDSGFQAYVAKPVEPFDLANAVARLTKSGDTRQLQ